MSNSRSNHSLSSLGKPDRLGVVPLGFTSGSGNPVHRNSLSNVRGRTVGGHQLVLARDTVTLLATCSFRPAASIHVGWVSMGWWLPLSDQYYNPSWGLYIHLSRFLLPSASKSTFQLQWEEPPETQIWPWHFPASCCQCPEILVFRKKSAKNPKIDSIQCVSTAWLAPPSNTTMDWFYKYYHLLFLIKSSEISSDHNRALNSVSWLCLSSAPHCTLWP